MFNKIIIFSLFILFVIVVIYYIYKEIQDYYHEKYLNTIEKTIVILRHGEKGNPAKGNLRCKGLNRALALPNMLLNRYGTNVKGIFSTQPIYIRDPKENDNNSWYLRPIITIEPLSIKLQLPLNIRYNFQSPTELKKLANILYKKQNGLYIVSWEHKSISTLISNLLNNYNIKSDIPEWNTDEYGRIYVVRVFKNGKVKIDIERENLSWRLTESCPC